MILRRKREGEGLRLKQANWKEKEEEIVGGEKTMQSSARGKKGI